MARPPKIRAHYNRDAAFLMTLSQAIERDKTRDVQWRREAMELCSALASKLLTAPTPSIPSVEESH